MKSASTIAVLVALDREINPLLALTQAVPATPLGGRACWSASLMDDSGIEHPLLFMNMGIGRSNAAAAVALVAREGVGAIFNFGTCGSLYTGEYEVLGRYHRIGAGEVVCPEQLIDGDWDMRSFGLPTRDPANCGGTEAVVRLMTVSQFPETLPQQEACLLDMEAYAIAAVTKALELPTKICKVVTNAGATESVTQFKQTVVQCCEAAAPEVIAHLKAFAAQCR